MFIVSSWPTGCGKSTSLSTFLSILNTKERRIVTVEDPVEYQLPGVIQIAVKPEIDLTFANGLRSILRGDPNVIMVGEMRDRETAEIAIRGALTGHLVFSTLHTNDAIGGIPLRQYGWTKVYEGVTTIEEVVRVTAAELEMAEE